jgi:exodeoxyribonuclease VII large subunit
LQGDSARLSAPLLQSRMDRAQDRLKAARLMPVLVQRPLDDRRLQLAALARLAQQLHPERPLQRGYAMVLNSQGKALTDAASARRETALVLKFRDGTLDVSPGADGQAPAAKLPPRASARQAPVKPQQPNLFD